MKLILFGQSWELSAHKMLWYFAQVVRCDFTKVPHHAFVLYIRLSFTDLHFFFLYTQGSKLRGAEGQNAPKLSPNAPRLLNLGAKFCYPIQPDICFEA